MNGTGCLVVIAILIIIPIVLFSMIVSFGLSIAGLGTLTSVSNYMWHVPHWGMNVDAMQALVFGQFVNLGRWLFTALIVVLACVLAPKGVQNTVGNVKRDPYASLGWGVIVYFVAVCLAVLFGLTIIGIPLAMLITIGMTFVRAFGIAAVGVVLGRWVRGFVGDRGDAPLLTDASIGVAAMFIVNLLPVIGGFVMFIVGLIAVGSVYTTWRSNRVAA